MRGERGHAGAGRGGGHLLLPVPPHAGRPPPGQRLPRHRLPRGRRGEGDRGPAPPPGAGGGGGHRRGPALHRAEGRLPGLLLAGARDADRRAHLRPPDPRVGPPHAGAVPAPGLRAAGRGAARPARARHGWRGRGPRRARLLLRGQRQRRRGGAGGRGAAGDGRGRGGQVRRLRGHVPPRAAGGVRRRGRPACALRQRDAGRGGQHRGRAGASVRRPGPCAGRAASGGRAADRRLRLATRGRLRARPRERPGPRLPGQAGGRRPGGAGRDGPRGHRRLPRPRRLCRARAVRARDGARGRDRDGREVRPARARRGRLPDRAEVGHGAPPAGLAEVHRHERRRRRPRRVHGPHDAGVLPAPHPRGAGHRGVRGRRGRGVPLHPRGVSAGGRARSGGHPPGERARLPGRAGARERLRPAGPDHGGRGRVRLRRGDRADRLAGGPARDAALPPAVPRSTGPLGPADERQQRGDLRHGALDHPQRRGGAATGSARRPARARRSSRWPARSCAAG